MKLKDNSKFAIFVYRFLAFELAGQLILSLLPTGLQVGIYAEFLLRWILFYGLIGVILWYLSQIIREFKARGFLSLIPLFVFAVRIICLPLLFGYFGNVKFLVVKKMYKEVTYLTEQGFLKENKPNGDFGLASLGVWYIGGQRYSIETIKSNDQDLIFFNETGILWSECGYLHSSDDTYPQTTGAIALGFNRISKNWFYGCLDYGD